MKLRDENQCPFLMDPFDECYVSDLHSQNIEKAMYFCRGNFERCEIYCSNIEKDRPATNKACGNITSNLTDE